MSERGDGRRLVLAILGLGAAIAAFVALVVLVAHDVPPRGVPTIAAGLLAGSLIILAARALVGATRPGVLDHIVAVHELSAAPPIEQIRALRIMGMTFTEAKAATVNGLDEYVSTPLPRREASELATTLRRHGVKVEVTPTGP